MKDQEKPHALGFVEANLKGADLNAARRRFSSLGWASHCTPAVEKAARMRQEQELSNQMKAEPKSPTTPVGEFCSDKLAFKLQAINKILQQLATDQSSSGSLAGRST